VIDDQGARPRVGRAKHASRAGAKDECLDFHTPPPAANPRSAQGR